MVKTLLCVTSCIKCHFEAILSQLGNLFLKFINRDRRCLTNASRSTTAMSEIHVVELMYAATKCLNDSVPLPVTLLFISISGCGRSGLRTDMNQRLIKRSSSIRYNLELAWSMSNILDISNAFILVNLKAELSAARLALVISIE